MAACLKWKVETNLVHVDFYEPRRTVFSFTIRKVCDGTDDLQATLRHVVSQECERIWGAPPAKWRVCAERKGDEENVWVVTIRPASLWAQDNVTCGNSICLVVLKSVVHAATIVGTWVELMARRGVK